MLRTTVTTAVRRHGCASSSRLIMVPRSSSTPVVAITRRVKSTTSSTPPSAPLLESDAGAMGTKIHHTLAHSMAILAPAYLLVPDSYTENWMHRSMGVLLGANMGMHAWIGLNYVATDYVPKISHALLGPSRFVTAGLAVTILLGMTKISVMSPGGIKGVLKGVWNGKRNDQFDF